MKWRELLRELIATAAVILFALAVWRMGAFDWADPYQYIARKAREAYDSPPTSLRLESSRLPTRCRVYYTDGTDRWIECMGVGYREE